ncbi:MAG: response regulator transcription factor [Coprobacter sp.]|nr:response regulator transcription factor [Coprobacter sp.]
MDKSEMRLLVVDDEETLREGLRTYLEQEGYRVDSAASAEEALGFGLAGYDLILLDIMMDGMSGTELAARLKGVPETAGIPIIFLSARDRDDDMVEGLWLGADDYIVKPFSVKNVMARIAAVLRRTAGRKRECGIVCDRQRLSCTVDGKGVKLPRKEFEILALFLENRGRIFTREEVMRRVWPESVVVSDRSVDVHITRLRNKIAPYGKKIISRSGYGYGWQD